MAGLRHARVQVTCVAASYLGARQLSDAFDTAFSRYRGTAAGVVIQWDATTFKEKSRMTLTGRVAAVVVTADGKRIAAAVAAPLERTENYDEAIYVWLAATPPAKLAPLFRHAAGGPFVGQAGLAFAPDGKAIAAGFCNLTHLSRTGELIGKVRVWDLTAKR